LQPEPLTVFTARIRVGRCHSLRSKSKVSNIDAEWDRVEFSLGNNWREEILWFGSDIVLESPRENVAEIASLLKSKL